jgi:hypothetical protein
MAELSEEELLLLSTLIYEDSVAEGKYSTVGDLIAHYEGLSDEEWAKIEWRSDFGFMEENGTGDPVAAFKEVYEKIGDSTELMSLQITNPVLAEGGRNDITAVCFVDPDDGTATVAFRGTDASYVTWKDNLEAAGNLGLTPMEKSAVAYIESLPYTEINVTGHSKGGHLAAVATLLCGDQVSRCVSYDGQGCSETFIKEYSDEIAANRDKITTYAAHNDFVHGLLFSVSGQTIYLENDGTGAEGHYVTRLLNDNTFDSEGNFTSIRAQSPEFALLYAYIDTLIVLMPPGCEEEFTDFVGFFASLFLGKKNIDPLLVMEDFAKLVLSGGLNNLPQKIFIVQLLAVTALYLVVIAIVVIAIAVAITLAIKLLEELLVELGKLAVEFGEWAVSVVTELGTIISNFIDSISEWLKENFDTGYKYATENPYFKVDTYKLRDYADRLDSVLTRLGNIDSRLDDIPVLELTVDEALYLAAADYNINKNKVISGSISYLNDSADEFERIESEIIAQLGG